jgi:hypothetical protein
MLKVDGALCYSPHVPNSYNNGKIGFGALCGGDLQLWNLAFLSCPGIDDHLNSPSSAVAAGLVLRDLQALSAAIATLGDCSGFFPSVRDSLKKPPIAFLQDVWRLHNWEDLPQVLFIPNWTETVIERALQIEASTRAKISALITGPAVKPISYYLGGDRDPV